MKPKLVAAVILGGMTGVATNVAFGSGLRSPASPGSIIAVWAASPPGALIGVTLSVIFSAGVSFLVAAFLLKLDRGEEGDLGAATSAMEAHKGKASSISGALLGSGAATAGGPIRSIVFACDAGMGSSAMGASVLRKKVHAAGFGDVTVVNKAISNLTDDIDLVVTHQDLTDRARERTGSAIHVSVENFMGSPRYDEIVELLHRTNGSGGAAPAAEADAGPSSGSLLDPESIVLDAASEDRDDAITRAGRLLVAAGAVDDAYVDAMHARETSVSHLHGQTCSPSRTAPTRRSRRSSVRPSRSSATRTPSSGRASRSSSSSVSPPSATTHLALLRTHRRGVRGQGAGRAPRGGAVHRRRDGGPGGRPAPPEPRHARSRPRRTRSPSGSPRLRALRPTSAQTRAVWRRTCLTRVLPVPSRSSSRCAESAPQPALVRKERRESSVAIVQVTARVKRSAARVSAAAWRSRDPCPLPSSPGATVQLGELAVGGPGRSRGRQRGR